MCADVLRASTVGRCGSERNVEYGRGPILNARRKARFAEADATADIWILTETHDDLSPGCEFREVQSTHQRPGVGQIDGVVAGSRWASIWSRKPLTPVAVSDPERTTAALVDLGGAKLLVYVTVLPWYTDAERDGMSNELAAQGLNG